MTLATAIAIWKCSECGLERLKPPPPRLPRGWKRQAGGDDVLCPQCWRKHFVLRAVAVPIASPLETTWKDLDVALRAMWAGTTAASNWMMTEFYAHDVRRQGEAKMPPMPRLYLYPEARRRFPQLPSQTVAALEQATAAKYRARRYDVIWRAAASLPTFRYPTPFPVPNQAWSVSLEGNAPVVSVRVAEERWKLRLKGGPQFRRQRRAIDQMIAGEAVRGELALYKQGKDTMVKLVAWLPRGEPGKLTGILRVKTEAKSLLVAFNLRDEAIWTYNGDQVRRWAAEHKRQLQRWSEDTKAENRPVPSFAPRREEAAARYHRRMATACHEIAAHLAGYARRRHFAGVQYDESDHSFCAEFPWARLRQLLEEKLDKEGMTLEVKEAEAEEAKGEE